MKFFTRRHLLSPLLLLFICYIYFSSAGNHHIRHYRDRFKRQQGAHLYLPGSYVTDGDDDNQVDTGPWSDWSSPSQCSRTCGGGVSSQYRQCADGYSCTGPSKRHFSCNTQDCPDLGDFRAQQCSEYDNIPFDGVAYRWIPYTKAPNPCELNCMPKGERFYYRHKQKVTDGTRCNDEKMDVCVDGKCQPVGCDMMLGSEAKEDKCRQCGGDGSTCKTITGTLDMQDLQVGYNDVLLIPAGATNVHVREKGPSNNYLAVRNTTAHYYLNGNWRIDFPSVVEFAGCKFHYERYPQGFPAPDKLTCLGPTDEALFIVLLYQDVNVGIDYEYSVPKNVQAGSELETYAWTFDEYSPCTASCGGGVQYRNVTCSGRRTLEPGDRNLCDQSNEPTSLQKCNEFPCPPQWVTKQWEKCSAPCGSEGVQKRQVTCEQVIANGVASIVDNTQCANISMPNEEQPCNQGRECGTWHTGPWKPCDHLCGEGKETRQVTCYRKDSDKIEVLDDEDCSTEPRPESEKTCNLRPCEGLDWVTSDWSGCDKCGLTNETRRVQCATVKGKVYPDELCETKKPEALRECKSNGETKCEYEWYASQWSDCSAKCGSGVQTRKVFCAKINDDGMKKVEDDKCIAEKKYEAIMNCTGEKESCSGEWFTGPWKECTKKCGGGEKSRKVICLKDDVAVAATECGPDTLPPNSEVCNEQPCTKDEILPIDITKSVDESEPTEMTLSMDTKEDVLSTTEPTETSSEMPTEDDEEVEYEIVESDTCDDGEWVEVDDLTESTNDLGESTESNTEKMSESSLKDDNLMQGDDPNIILPSTEGSGDGESTYSTDSTISTIEGSGDESSTTDSEMKTGSTEDVEDVFVGESVSGLKTVVEKSTGTTKVTEQFTGTTDSTTEFTGSTETEVTETTTEFTGSTETDVTETTTEFTGSTETEITETTTAFTGSTETEITETTTEFTGSTETDVTETTTEFTGSTETEVTETTTEFTGSTETEITEATTEFTGSTETEITETTTEFTGTTEEEVTETTEEFTGSTEATETTTEFTGSTESTESPEPTTEFTGSTETTESPEPTTEFTGSTESTESPEPTTEFTGSTEATESTTEFTGSTESTESTTEFTGSTESTTEFTGSTESTTEYTGSTESTTEYTGSTESTEFDIWSSTTETSTIMEIFTTGKPKMCKRKKRKDCKKSTFGCCPDKVTPAKGPFDKDCPMPKTCKESEFGCCTDEVSQALGKNFMGCPKSLCDQSLFGCCPDKKTFAEGNNNEGCPPPPPACLKSKFGCCEDNVTAAKGPKQKGCEPEVPTPEPQVDKKQPTPSTSCETSSYGCCPDGVTAAEGANYKGCKLECAKTAYGCCQDGHTPAHGYNREGCCLQTPFGCCPDNIKPAEGPQLEGCGCQYSPYKCCPDNITSAKGHNKEGCGCQYTEHGCCPDNNTPAPGENYEGCPCHTYQFGCCPDGVTIATGPSQQGCGCRYSEHGCCSDEKTSAKGSNFEGCTCVDSKYGCCYDGVTEAKGENFDGCEDVPANLQESCSMPRENGECKNYTIKWYYDSEYGACSRFWYGGCGGNGNRYKSKEECDAVCVEPQGKERCTLQNIKGPCTGYYPVWYYDKDRNHCAQFIWGGCLGNNNRFETSKECEDMCLKGSSGDVCQQPREEGPCHGSYERWYYDTNSDSCQRFVYGGCQGNGNNFQTEAACLQQCTAPGKQKDHCSLPHAEGNCTEKLARWYHNESKGKCMPFYYTGCGSNNNNFASIEECERECPPKVELDTCQLPAEVGECGNYVDRWYYDTKERLCRQFYYGGCGGNGNNFATENECLGSCQNKSTTLMLPTTLPTQPPFREPIQEHMCELPSDTGNCDNYTSRFYYKKEEGRCEHFYYGGCGGNSNNFNTMEDCERQCSQRTVATVATTPAPAVIPSGEKNKCEHKYDTGGCFNYTERWYYDYENQYCRQFYYGGCGGNDNKFYTQEECEKECHSPQPSIVEQDTGLCKLELYRPPCAEESNGRWYYDYRSDECVVFTYEGCLQKGNNFMDKDTCERTCKKSSSREFAVTQAPHELSQCDMPVDPGNCTESIPAYYFDSSQQKCITFMYSGCGGNTNRYSTVEQCERQCGEFKQQDICNLPQETGPCRANIIKIYYDKEQQRCLEFRYGGCGGNANRFSSMEECEGICITHEERKPNETSTAICKLQLDVGVCKESHKRWYFNDDRGECITFIYSGCGGNFNRFKSFNECVKTCSEYMPYNPDLEDNKIELPIEQAEHPCQKYADECTRLRCPYGVESFVDEKFCNRCKCYNPCDKKECDSDSVCGIDVNVNKTTIEDPDFIGVCRQINKPGECPELTPSYENCGDECSTDAECQLDLKCCNWGCRTSCVAPISHPPPGELVTAQYLPAYTEAPVEQGYYAPVVDEANFQPNLRGVEGDYVTLRCSVRGNPSPKITWSKNNLVIDGKKERYRLLLDGALQIVTLHKTDSGVYLCTADNKLGPSITNQIKLEVTDGEPNPASILDDQLDKNVVVSLGSPTTLNCYALGYPFPTITWFKDKNLIPLKTTKYEVRKDYSLLINSVKLPDLGIYTCQVYNGYGKAASWSVTVQALGPVESTNPEDEQYLQYIVDQPVQPEDQRNPQSPANTLVRPTPQPYPPHHKNTNPDEEVEVENPNQPQESRVPVWTTIPLYRNRYRVGSNITIPCVVTGHPPPRVTWLKDSQPLHQSEKYRIEVTGENYTLTILNADRSDAANYKCEARNHYSRAQSDTTIDIEGVNIPADCKDNPFLANCKLIVKGRYCANEYYANFCCRSCTEAGLIKPHQSPSDEKYAALDSNLVQRK